MGPKLIYCEAHKEEYLRNTYVELIGDGDYAVTQTGIKSNKWQHSVIYLSRKQIAEILKEQEVKE